MVGTVANMEYIFGDPGKRTPKQKISWAERDQKMKERGFYQIKQTSVTEVVNPSKTLPTWRDIYSLPWNNMMYGDPDKRTPEQILFLANIQPWRNEVEESNLQLTSVTELVMEEKIAQPEQTSVTEVFREETVKHPEKVL